MNSYNAKVDVIFFNLFDREKIKAWAQNQLLLLSLCVYVTLTTYCVNLPEFLFHASIGKWNSSLMLTYRNWLIKLLELLFKNKTFWFLGACSDWALNWTWVLIEKLKKENLHENHKVLSKIPSKFDDKNPFFPFFQISVQLLLDALTKLGANKEFPPKDWMFIRTGCLIESWALKRSFMVLAE